MVTVTLQIPEDQIPLPCQAFYCSEGNRHDLPQRPQNSALEQNRGDARFSRTLTETRTSTPTTADGLHHLL